MKKIDWTKWSAIAEILSAVAIVVTLIYLGDQTAELSVQTEQNNLLMRSQARSGISDTLVQMLFQMASDPELTEISRRARLGEELTEVEYEQFLVLQQALWRYRENVSYQYRNGLFDEAEYNAQREAWRQNINSIDRVREIWCGRLERQSQAFVEDINGLLDEPCE